MDSTPTVVRHPVLSCAEQVDAALKAVADVETVFMSPTDKREALVGLSELVDRLCALRLKVVAVAEDVADLDGHRNVAAWLAAHTWSDGSPKRRDLRLAEALERRWGATGAALIEGWVH